MSPIVRKHKRNLNPIIFMFSLIVLGKVTGFGKDLLLSYFHGASSVTDAYFMANSIASMSYAALYMTIPVIIIPYFSKLDGTTEEAHNKIRIYPILKSFVFISLVISVFVYVGAADVVSILFPELNIETKTYTFNFIKIIALTFVLSTVVAVLNAVQVLKEKRLNSLFVPLANNSAFIFSILVFTSIEDFKYVLWAGFFAWVFLVIINYISSKNIVSFCYSAGLPLFEDRKLLFIFFPALLVFYVEQFNSYISVFFASGLEFSAVSFLSYANKLNLLIVSLFIIFLNVYAFPKLSAKRFKQQEEISGLLIAIVESIAIFCFPIVLILYSFAEPVIAIVFERGQFSISDVREVSSVFKMLALSLPLVLLRDLLNRAVFAYENSILSLIALVGSVILHIIFVRYYLLIYGLPGIAVGVAVSALINSIILIVFLRVCFKVKLVYSSFKTVFICLLLLVVLGLFLSLFAEYVELVWWVESLIILVSYFCCLYLLKVEQFHNVIRWLAFR